MWVCAHKQWFLWSPEASATPGAGITGELPNSVGVNTETQVLCKTHEPSLQWGKFVFLFLCFVSKPTLALNFWSSYLPLPFAGFTDLCNHDCLGGFFFVVFVTPVFPHPASLFGSVFYCFICFLNRVYSPAYHESHYVDQAGLRFIEICSTFQVLEYKGAPLKFYLLTSLFNPNIFILYPPLQLSDFVFELFHCCEILSAFPF